MVTSRARAVLLSGLVLLTAGAFALSQFVNAEIVSLPLFTIGTVSTLFIVYLTVVHISPLQSIDLAHPKVADIAIFLLIIAGVFLGRVAESGVTDWYYPVVIVTGALLAFRIASPPTKVPLQLGQIVLLALVVRLTPWYSYPVYGQDRFHHTAVQYIRLTGDIVPESITYYANFPAGHVFSASYAIIGSMPFKSGYFAFGVVVALSLVGVYLLGRNLLNDNRAALFGALFVGVSAYHIKAGAEPFAQALLTAIIPFVFYLLFRQSRSRRRTSILIFLSAFAVTVQNIAPLVLLGVCLGALLTGWVFAKVSRLQPLGSLKTQFNFPIAVVALIGIIGVYYYTLADYLRFQTMRIIWLVESLIGRSGGTGQTVIEDTGISGVPTVEMFGQELPGVLMWAAPILTVAGVLILAAYLVLYGMLKTDPDLGPLQYISMATVVYTAFAIVFVAGGPATRAMPSVIVLTAPVVGWVFYQFLDDQPAVGRVIAIIIILNVVTAGVLTPPVAKSELGEDDFRAWMDSDEVAAADFAVMYTDKTLTSNYVAGYERFLIRPSENQDVGPVLNGSMNKDDPMSVVAFSSRGENGTTVLYLSYFQSAYGIEPPSTNKIFTSGNASIYT